jgi:hypothetical protein
MGQERSSADDLTAGVEVAGPKLRGLVADRKTARPAANLQRILAVSSL